MARKSWKLRRKVLEIHPRSEARKHLLHQLADRQVCDSSSCPRGCLLLDPSRSARHSGSCGRRAGRSGPADVKHCGGFNRGRVLHDDLVPLQSLIWPHTALRCECGQTLREEINHAGRDQRDDDQSCARNRSVVSSRAATRSSLARPKR